MKTLLHSVTLIGLLAATIHAQEDGPPHHKHLTFLNRLVGEWEGDFDPPGDVPAGKVHVECKWMCHKTYLSIEGTFTIDDPDSGEVAFQLNPINLFIGYNGAVQSPYAWQLGLNGQLTMPIEVQKDGFVMRGQGHHINGDVISQTVTYTFRSDDELVSRTTERKRGEKKLEDEDPLTLRRIKAK
jgi:hypothetical protein